MRRPSRSARRHPRHRGITGSAHALIWEGSLGPDAARQYARQRLGLDLVGIAEAGGGSALDERPSGARASRRRRCADVGRLHSGLGAAAARAARFPGGAAAPRRRGGVDRRDAGTGRRTRSHRGRACHVEPRDRAARGSASSTSRRAPHDPAAFRDRRPSRTKARAASSRRSPRMTRSRSRRTPERRRTRVPIRCGSTARCSTSSSTRRVFNVRARRSRGSRRTTAARASAQPWSRSSRRRTRTIRAFKTSASS